MDTITQTRSKNYSEALDFARREIPSLLPNSNPYKGRVEAHRWGQHHDGPVKGCPVCENRK